jgi:hypothetical protein
VSKSLIKIINNSTQEMINNAGVTKKLEFIDEFDIPVPEGIPYHIHITDDKSYWYMTAGKHETASILIFKVGGKESDFVKYRNLIGSRRQEYLSETRRAPLLSDYERGFFTLYFARQANDRDAKVFEISRDDFREDTPFYIKIDLTLRITGEKSSVSNTNVARILSKEKRGIPGIADIISPLQFYRPSKNTKESVQDRLKNYQQETPSSTSAGGSGGSSGGGY